MALNLKLKRGALHKDLGISKDKKIPVKKLQKAKAKGGIEAKRAQFAINARKWNHSGGGRRKLSMA